MSNDSNNLYEFDEYVLNAKERNLWRGKELVLIPTKALETLLMLVERDGEVISKEEMLEKIWDGAFVEENNLSQKISILRKAFGSEKEFIQTVPKVGFRFIEPVKRSAIEETNGLQFHTDKHPLTETDVGKPAASFRRFGYPIAAFLSIPILGALAFSFFALWKDSSSVIPSSSFEYIELTDTGDIGSSAISPDGKFVAFTKINNHNENIKTSLRLMDVESRNDVEIPIEGDINPGILRFSPDGKSIYFRTNGNRAQYEQIQRISILGGEPKLIAENIWGSFSISPDGRELVYFRRQTEGTTLELMVREIETGKEVSIYGTMDRIEVSSRGAPVFSPDQKLIAFIAPKKNSGNGKIAILELKSKSVKMLDTDFYSISEIAWHPDGKNLFIKALKLGKSFQVWSISYPDGEIARVTSDSDSYESLNVANDGLISVNRVNLYSNLWLIPEAKLENARQLTKGENGLSGLLTVLSLPNGEILFNTRDKEGAGIRVLDIAANTKEPLTKKQLRTEHYFSFAREKRILFFEFENQIWQRNFDGSNEKQFKLDDSSQNKQPAVSYDEKWLYFVRREKTSTSIRRSSIDGGEEILVLRTKDFSPDTFLSASPDGKYLAFEYVKSEKIADNRKNPKNIRQFGFLSLETGEVKVIKVPAYNTTLRWTNDGRSFDFLSYTNAGTSILRKNLDDDQDAAKIFEIENEIIYRFDWSPDGKDLVVGRGNLTTNLALLRVVAPIQKRNVAWIALFQMPNRINVHQ